MAYLYGVVRLYVNYFQPSFKLVEKTRDGASVVKRYSPPATLCDRLMQHDTVSAKLVAKLSEFRGRTGPSGIAAHHQGSSVGAGGCHLSGLQ